MNNSYKTAGAIALVFVAYFGVNTVFKNSSNSGSVQESEVVDEKFLVQVTPTAPQFWQEQVIVRGRTKPLRKVTVRSETPGTVARTSIDIGADVNQGAVLCQLRVDARRAQYDQAKAAIAKANIDFEAARTLRKEGFGAQTAEATMKAALDLAKANLRQAELSLEQTKIKAPFDGIFDQRFVEVGDYLGVGDPCGVVIQQTPFLIVGSLSEREVGKVSKGDRGVATLATGENIEGTVRFIGSAADEATRTFDIELEVSNDDGRLRDGVTAEFTIFANQRDAYKLRRSALIINDEGRLGVRVTDDENIVRFRPVTLLGESVDGIWVSGLNGTVNLITRGQEFVLEGQSVKINEDNNADSQGSGETS